MTKGMIMIKPECEENVPDFLKDAISELIFKGENIVYDFEKHYSPTRALKKAHIISDKKPDGTVEMKRFIVSYVTNAGIVEIFNITEDKMNW